MSILNPEDSLERQNEKLLQISAALMRRVEQDTDRSGLAYIQFERAAMLEDEVRSRTRDLERTLDLLHESNARLAEANAATEQARTDLTDAIEAVSEGFALFSPDDTLVLSNSRFCQQMLDVSDELHPGLSFVDYVQLISESRFLALPDGQGPSDWAQRRISRHRDKSVMFNVRLIWDRWLQVSEHRTGNGGTVILQTDITDIMRIEREERSKLIDKQARMVRATLDHLNQGVCIFDRNARLAGWNRKVGTLLSVPATRFRIGAGFHQLLDRLSDDIRFEGGVTRKDLVAWIAQTADRPPLSFEIRSGDSMTLAVFCQEMPDHGFVISFTDVSAEREAARALFDANELLEQRVLDRTLDLEDALAAAERANASKSRFVAAASHDLLQPLSAAKLYVSALDGPTRTAADKAIIHKAESALSSVEQIIDALLDISRLEAGKASFDVAPVPLMDVLTPLQSEMEPLAKAKGLEFKVVPSSAVISSDAAFLRRILRNLISNAIRYTDSGRVLVGARHHGRSVRMEIWDTGPGIAEGDQDLIFKEFSRLDTRASASEGLGLGLAIVERACARLGHPLGLWSEVGRGSGFFVSLPLADAHGERPRSDPPRSGATILDQTGLIVLLVDNDLEFRRALSLLMERWGVSVLDAEHGADALSLLDDIQICPDAVLIDQQLGCEQNGLELLAQLRIRYPHFPAAIVSANRSSALRQACQDADVPLINKPIDPQRLETFLTDAAKVLQG
ncbi:PAS-domain containing protein [Actibacterium sp. 188UL27-1]|uniref:hybrid sensor histidine kinase/response regulator n=1 Tax=Actibacterium sp. 188UL27-1 TaxID=2786961 RepID=UPI0019588A2C|nr:PAS-domain containing protein [Actibacterium sp. 188UL27-1]MBM7066399.1 PAS-domain containing protein [Actibacterium sp. 188UL27-1]